ALADGVPVAVAQLPADAEEAVAVRPGARAPRAALDPEEVVQQDGDELGMEAAAVAVAEVERDDADALRGVGRAEDLDPLVAAPPCERARQQRVLARLEGVEAEGPLELQRQRGAEDLEHARRPRLLPRLDVGREVVPARTDVVHGPAAADAR